ncbi:helix-turn-helix transcriptional regulator [Mesorhizobium sp. WSM4884]|uniref:helix-turn-helix domain-containing protein n=1 Tax=Mesorhizobium sp. WSM4884 TaxID=3038542 RepID=UPI002415D4F8|nr:helix-turn-helix transcriptional regulator [Mesorhizobium sp. WSM4884]MDG4881815.1 helix-turn-helix transcriptional regulator [Mesorhizobium sp. WSM4884]
MSEGRDGVDKTWFVNKMKERNLTVRSMAGRMGMHYSALSRTLSGERRMQVDEIRKIAEIFDQPVSEILVHLGSSGAPVDAKPRAAQESRPGFAEGHMDFNDTDANEDYIVPPPGADPLFGCMAGTLKLLPDVDYTAPADPDWGKVYDR